MLPNLSAPSTVCGLCGTREREQRLPQSVCGQPRNGMKTRGGWGADGDRTPSGGHASESGAQQTMRIGVYYVRAEGIGR